MGVLIHCYLFICINFLSFSWCFQQDIANAWKGQLKNFNINIIIALDVLALCPLLPLLYYFSNFRFKTSLLAVEFLEANFLISSNITLLFIWPHDFRD